MRTDTAAAIRRLDYAPPTYWIDAVEITFDLDPEATLVHTQLHLRRNPDSPDSGLVLHGDELELVALRLDGQALPESAYERQGDNLYLQELPEQGVLEVETRLKPKSNTTLMGLYVSNGNFFTQCEAEGFRRITFFPDRPDVMATYRVLLRADRQQYATLLSNGNLIEEGDLPGGRHYALWEDPFPKPSYLFALVAGQLVRQEEKFRVQSGREVLLQIWVEHGNLDKTQHAMDSLKNSIRWDEERFGLELDLDRFMIVAVGDFNMGAMENKGLNIFNTKYVLANPQIATDVDYANIESVVGHEYFHNWTGNRVTCRDWFQLSLKEGLTVFRDQEFSADMTGTSSGRVVKRIEDVRMLRQAQFPEDAGPMAHPVRPDAYVEINNFYTVTIYEKGAEVVRMYQTLLGREGFRRGLDLYFSRHDGQAVTCDDFRAAMADANTRDLTQFERWYSQAGTPHVHVAAEYDADNQCFTLTLTQSCAPSAGQPDKLPFHIPVAVGLLDEDGNDLVLHPQDFTPLVSDEASLQGQKTVVLELTEATQSFCFTQVPHKPVPSLLRNFSAPVVLDYDYSDKELAFLAEHDSDAFNRWEAGQRLAVRHLLHLAETGVQAASTEEAHAIPAGLQALLNSFEVTLNDERLDRAFREVALILPSETLLAEQVLEVDPQSIHAARQSVRRLLASVLEQDWLATYQFCRPPNQAYSPDPVSAGRRALKNLALSYLGELDDERVHDLAQKQFDNTDNMTDRVAALAVLINSSASTRGKALEQFYVDYQDEPLVVDKWFSLQATARTTSLAQVRDLMRHPAFSLNNPNRARSLIYGFCNGNPAQFHAHDGSGYDFWAEQVVALDVINPQIAARLARTLDRWRKYAPILRDAMQAALERVKSTPGLSRDTLEVVTKSLAP